MSVDYEIRLLQNDHCLVINLMAYYYMFLYQDSSSRWYPQCTVDLSHFTSVIITPDFTLQRTSQSSRQFLGSQLIDSRLKGQTLKFRSNTYAIIYSCIFSSDDFW